MTRPAEFPPPFSVSEVIGAPTDAPDERIDVGWKGEPRLALVRSGAFDPAETSGTAEVVDATADIEEFSLATKMVE